VFFVRKILKGNFLPFAFALTSFFTTFSDLAAALTLRLAILGAGGATGATWASTNVMLFVCLSEGD
jgi:hypothetical protein